MPDFIVKKLPYALSFPGRTGTESAAIQAGIKDQMRTSIHSVFRCVFLVWRQTVRDVISYLGLLCLARMI